MSESGDSGPGRREVAHRLFAAEFDDADFSYSESDEERAPNYVVTPTGARVNRLFLVGVLTELEQVNDDVLRARVVDPTGPFVIYAGQYQPDELAFLEAADPPMFVAVTGKARTFQPDDSDRVFTSVRPESISEVDADTRDRWVVQAAEQTVSRIGQMASAKQAGLAGDELRLALLDRGIDESAAAGITLALDHYGTTGDYLDALRTTALDAARVVAGDTDEAEGLSLSPDDGTDDPIPLLASLDLDTDVSTPETATEDAEGDATATDSGATEPTTDEEVADAAEKGAPADAADAEPAPGSPGAPAGDESTEPDAGAATSDAPVETPETATDAAADETTPGESVGEDVSSTPEQSEPVDEPPVSSEPVTDADAMGQDEPESSSEPDDGGDLGDFDTEFELDEDEREEIEQEYGTDFQSGTEVDEPGEADIETPDHEELADAAQEGAPADAADAEPAPGSPGAPAGDESPEPTADAATSDAPAETPETATDAAADETTPDESASEDAPTEDVDLEDAVMAVMDDLDDGSGADREELRSTVVSRHGADADAVEDAIQDALMGGRCYEPEDGKLTPI
jgi:RPA family protein